MNTTQLRYFITAAQLQNLSRAAALLHLSQPSLSKSISRLEEEIGVPLFNRNGKKLTLNAQGQRFMESASRILKEADHAVTEIQEMGRANSLSIGIFEAESMVQDCLCAFSQEHPGIRFHIDCSLEPDDSVDINNYDMLVYPSSPAFDKYKGYELGTDPYLLALPASHPLARTPLIRLSRLEGASFVFMKSRGTWTELPFKLCSAMNLSFSVQCFTDSRSMHRYMIANNHLAGFVPESCSGLYRSDPKIALLHISDEKFSKKMMLCFKRDKHLSDLAKEFKRFTLDYMHLVQQETENSEKSKGGTPHADSKNT